jgi:hypothetical protein
VRNNTTLAINRSMKTSQEQFRNKCNRCPNIADVRKMLGSNEVGSEAHRIKGRANDHCLALWEVGNLALVLQIPRVSEHDSSTNLVLEILSQSTDGSVHHGAALTVIAATDVSKVSRESCANDVRAGNLTCILRR